MKLKAIHLIVLVCVLLLPIYAHGNDGNIDDTHLPLSLSSQQGYIVDQSVSDVVDIDYLQINTFGNSKQYVQVGPMIWDINQRRIAAKFQWEIITISGDRILEKSSRSLNIYGERFVKLQSSESCFHGVREIENRKTKSSQIFGYCYKGTKVIYKLWDSHTGKLIRVLRGLPEPIRISLEPSFIFEKNCTPQRGKTSSLVFYDIKDLFRKYKYSIKNGCVKDSAHQLTNSDLIKLKLKSGKNFFFKFNKLKLTIPPTPSLPDDEIEAVYNITLLKRDEWSVPYALRIKPQIIHRRQGRKRKINDLQAHTFKLDDPQYISKFMRTRANLAGPTLKNLKATYLPKTNTVFIKEIGKVMMWNVPLKAYQGTLFTLPKSHVRATTSFNRTGEMIAWRNHLFAMIFDLSNGRLLCSINSQFNQIGNDSRITFSPNSQFVAINGQGKIRVWDVQQCYESYVVEGNYFEWFSNRDVLLTLKSMWHFGSHNSIKLGAYDTSGSLISNMDIKLPNGFNKSDGKIKMRLGKHLSSELLTLINSDRRGVVLDLSSKRMIKHLRKVGYLEWSPNGNHLATATISNNVNNIIEIHSFQKTSKDRFRTKSKVIKSNKGLCLSFAWVDNQKIACGIAKVPSSVLSMATPNYRSKILKLVVESGSIYILDIRSGKHVSRIDQFYGFDVNDISYSNRGLIAVTTDHRVGILNKRGKLIANIFIPEISQWTISVPDKTMFMGTIDGVRSLMLRIKGRLHSLNQFILTFNRPHEVIKHIGLASKQTIKILYQTWLNWLRRNNVDPSNIPLLSSPLPKIKINSSGPLATDLTSWKVNVEVSSESVQLSQLKAYVNGVSVLERDLYQKNHNIDLEIPLLSGDNHIQITAWDQNNNQTARLSRFVVRSIPAKKPDLYIVALGVSDYEEATWRLPMAAKDATDVIDLFSKNIYSFDKVHTLLFKNKQVSRIRISEITEFYSRSKPEDVVILFLSGHGVLDRDNRYWFGTYDMNLERISESTIAFEELKQVITKSGAHRRLILMDTCHSGDVDEPSTDSYRSDPDLNHTREGKRLVSKGARLLKMKTRKTLNTDQLMMSLFPDLRQDTGATIIGSSSGREFAFESNEWNNGIFTRSLLRGLKYGFADSNHNGEITLSELLEYTRSEVSKATQGRQNPVARRVNPDLDFSVWRSRPSVFKTSVHRPYKISFDRSGKYVFINGRNESRIFNVKTSKSMYMKARTVFAWGPESQFAIIESEKTSGSNYNNKLVVYNLDSFDVIYEQPLPPKYSVTSAVFKGSGSVLLGVIDKTLKRVRNRIIKFKINSNSVGVYKEGYNMILKSNSDDLVTANLNQEIDHISFENGFKHDGSLSFIGFDSRSRIVFLKNRRYINAVPRSGGGYKSLYDTKTICDSCDNVRHVSLSDDGRFLIIKMKAWYLIDLQSKAIVFSNKNDSISLIELSPQNKIGVLLKTGEFSLYPSVDQCMEARRLNPKAKCIDI